MLSLFFAGIAVALGHHFIYLSLDGKPVPRTKCGSSQYIDQKWIGRYGTVFAFLTKTLFAAAVVVAYKQHLWTNFRRKPYTVSGTNALCAATTDFLALFSVESLLKTKVCTVLALITW